MDKFLRKKIVKKEIGMENKKFKIHKINIIAITMLFLCLCISFMARISTNQSFVEAKNMVEKLGTIKEGLPKEEADKIVESLKGAGATAVAE